MASQKQIIKIPISITELNQKLSEEAKRIVKDKEDDIVKYVSKKASLTGNSTMIFKKRDKSEVILAFRLNENNNLRLAYEKSLTDKAKIGQVR
ncbi:MAG: hypothetical protein AAB903_01275 [Patescibacteria group bacterium]